MEEEAAKPLTDLQIFAVLEQAQSNHGIPHQDYAQYHQYCTNRLARLRRVRQVRSQLIHSPKYVEGVSGQRHAYCPRHLTDPETGEPVVQHENLLWNVFFQAERAWAQACTLQLQQTQHYAQRRLNKAAKWAEKVHSMAVSLNCDDLTIQEAKSYARWMLGNAALEKKQYL